MHDFEVGKDGLAVIVVGVDGRSRAQNAAAWATRLARRERAELVLVYVEPLASPAYWSPIGVATAAYLDSAGVRWEFVHHRGDPAHGLEAVAAQRHADCIVVGRGGGVTRFLINDANVLSWSFPTVRGMTEHGEDYRDAALPGQQWEQRHFEQCTFVDADLRGLVTKGCTFDHCDFSGADLGESRHAATAFRSCTFERTNFMQSELTGCTLLGATFYQCRFRPWTIKETDLTLASLAEANLRTVTLAGLRFREANLVGADLRDADLTGADLRGARLREARLDGADLRGAKLDADGLTQAKLAGAHVDLDTAVAFAAAHGLRVG